MNKKCKEDDAICFSLYLGQYLPMWPRPGCVPIVSGTVDNTAESKMMEKESVVENRNQNAFVTLLER